ncbi:hypothetical protein HQ584_12905 [Patescibacteria group bacterium]|nr:hypothetical protein [Patescibacteria group bacterium]
MAEKIQGINIIIGGKARQTTLKNLWQQTLALWKEQPILLYGPRFGVALGMIDIELSEGEIHNLDYRYQILWEDSYPELCI